MTVWKQLQGAYTIDLAERMFAGINYCGMVGFALLIFMPRRTLTNWYTLVVPCAISVLYSFLFVWLTLQGLEFDVSVLAVSRILADPLAMVLIWAHWVAFDTLVARAITFDAAERGISNYVMGPILALMYGAGPLGFLVYAVVRTANYARPSTWKSKGE